METKPPTKTFPKLVMKERPKTQPELDDALARLLSPDFTRVLEGVEGQKETPLRKQGSSSHDSALLSGLTKPLHMPDDLVVVRSADADEAGDYRVMRHADAVGDSRWHVTDIDPKELD